MTHSLVDLLALTMESLYLVLEFISCNLTIEDVSATMVAKPIIKLRTNKNYWAEFTELDTGQTTINAHILAARILSSGEPITCSSINSVLASQNHGITQEELDVVMAISFTAYSLSPTGVVDPSFLRLYPCNLPVGEGRWGIYMYINNITGAYYVGSSTVLHERLRHYWKKWPADKKLCPILADIKKYGLQNFTLHVYELPREFYAMNLLLALEQYYLLVMNPANNTLMVAGGSPGGMAVAEKNRELNRKTVYVYRDDILLGVFPATFEGPSNLQDSMKIGVNTILTALQANQLLFGVFVLSYVPFTLSTVPTMTHDELREVIYEAGNASKSKQTLGLKAKAVNLVRLTDNKVYSFKSVTAAAKFIKKDTGKNANKNMLSTAVNTGTPVFGFTVIYINPQD